MIAVTHFVRVKIQCSSYAFATKCRKYCFCIIFNSFVQNDIDDFMVLFYVDGPIFMVHYVDASCFSRAMNDLVYDEIDIAFCLFIFDCGGDLAITQSNEEHIEFRDLALVLPRFVAHIGLFLRFRHSPAPS